MRIPQELKDLLLSCKTLAEFLSQYSTGRIHMEAEKVINRINKFLEEEELYGTENKM